MQITFDTANPQDLKLLNRLLDIQNAQPEVAQNTGTAASGFFTLSTEGSGVSEPVAEQPAQAAPEKKERKPRAKKGDAAEPVEKPVDTLPAEEPAQEEAAPAEAAAESPSEPLTIDSVRAALQQFTAAKGVPAGIELLKKFGAGRISELEEGDYAAFVAECAA